MSWWNSDRWWRCTWRNPKTGRRCARPAARCFYRFAEAVPWGRCDEHAALELPPVGERLRERGVAEVACEAALAEASAALRAIAGVK